MAKGDPLGNDEDGDEPASSTRPLEAVDNAHALEDNDDRPKYLSTKTFHMPYTFGPEENLENDTQKELDDLLALWTPIPRVGEEHSQVK